MLIGSDSRGELNCSTDLEMELGLNEINIDDHSNAIKYKEIRDTSCIVILVHLDSNKARTKKFD